MIVVVDVNVDVLVLVLVLEFWRMKMLSHERLDAYQIAIQFLAWSNEVIEALPRGTASLSDQLRRASLSIPLNIAEAVGKTGKADRQRFFAIARGSALECAAIVDACCVC